MYCLHPIKIKKREYEDWTEEEWSALPPRLRVLNTRSDGKRKKKVLPWNGEYMELPCGRCLACVDRRATDWTLRLLSEEYSSAQSVFVTLTYDEFHKPVDGKVCKSDVQRFNDTLRSHLDKLGVKLRFFLMSEYGPETFRPHYHGIYFFDKKVFVHYVEFARWLEKHAWKFGSVTCSYPFGPRIHYIARYSFKLLNLPDHLKDTNFMLCSRRPGIGAGYLNDLQFREYLQNHVSPMVMTVDGFRRLPRYYKDKVYSEEQREELKLQYDDYMESRFAKFCEKYGSTLSLDELEREYDLTQNNDREVWLRRKKKIYLKQGKYFKL